MKELSIFIDESGDFGNYDFHSPYYIVSFVFHNQENNINKNINVLDKNIKIFNLHNNCIHTGPIIRGEESYQNMNIHARRKILNSFFAFLKSINIQYKSFIIDKKHLVDNIELTYKLTKQISNFIKDNLLYFNKYNTVKIYYDYGQIELTKIIISIFNSLLTNVEITKANPCNYKLFQAADLFCYFTLLKLKYENKSLSKSEISFFDKPSLLYRNYFRQINNYTFS